MIEAQSLIDFGMCIVLWLVQLVIYPSFLWIESDQLKAWHKSYTFRVSVIIMPLMLAQLALAVYALLSAPSHGLDWIILGLVLLCWALTFFVSVPLHRNIQQGVYNSSICQRLVQTNWPRTVLWTLIFFLGLTD